MSAAEYNPSEQNTAFMTFQCTDAVSPPLFPRLSLANQRIRPSRRTCTYGTLARYRGRGERDDAHEW